jgi:hypothetical protein
MSGSKYNDIFFITSVSLHQTWMTISKNKIVATSLFEDEKVNKTSFLRML